MSSSRLHKRLVPSLLMRFHQRNIPRVGLCCARPGWVHRILRDRADHSPQQRRHVRFTFHAYKVVAVEKFIDNTFEYSFAYEYWPTGSIRRIVTTRARLGVLIEQFDEV